MFDLGCKKHLRFLLVSDSSHAKIKVISLSSIVIVSFVMLLFLPGSLRAESWEILPTIALEERYTDNINLSSVSAESTAETLLRAVVSLNRLTETSMLQGRLHSMFSSYAKNQQFLTFASKKQAQLSLWALDGLYRRDTTTRTIETIFDDIIEETVDGELTEEVDVGLTQLEVRKNTLRLTPAWSYKVSERMKWGIGYQLTDISYDSNEVGTGLFDYRQHAIYGSNTFSLDEQSTVKLSLGFSQYASDRSGSSANNYLFIAAFHKRLSEYTNAGVSLGLRRSVFDDLPEDTLREEINNGYLLGLQLTHITEFGKIRLRANHDIQPNGSGSMVGNNRLNINVQRKLLPRLSSNIDFRATENKSVNSTVKFTRYFGKISSGLNWNLTRWWSIGGGVQYRVREHLDSPNDADSYSVYVTLGYSKKTSLDF